MPHKLVTVGTFNSSVEASIVRSGLEAEGIQAFIADEGILGTDWSLGTAVCGVKLQVAESDVARAMSVIAARRNTYIPDDEWQTDTEAEPEELNELEEDGAALPVDEVLDRAFRAAVLGFGFLPLQLYSLWLLRRAISVDGAWTQMNRRRFAVTLILNLPVIGVLGLGFLWLVLA